MFENCAIDPHFLTTSRYTSKIGDLDAIRLEADSGPPIERIGNVEKFLQSCLSILRSESRRTHPSHGNNLTITLGRLPWIKRICGVMVLSLLLLLLLRRLLCGIIVRDDDRGLDRGGLLPLLLLLEDLVDRNPLPIWLPFAWGQGLWGE